MASKVILVDQANNLKCSANIKMQEIVEHMWWLKYFAVSISFSLFFLSLQQIDRILSWQESFINRIRLRILYLHCLVNETKLSVEKRRKSGGPQRRWKSNTHSLAHWHLMPIKDKEKESESCRVRMQASS